MSAKVDSTVAGQKRKIAELQRELGERSAECDALRRDLKDAEDRQRATGEVLGVINSSPGNLTPVFDAILEKAHSLCGAPLGSLVLFDGRELRAVATRGYSKEYDALARQGGPPHIVPAFELLLAGERVVQVPDARAAAADTAIARAAIEMAGIRSMLFVPLQKDDGVLGYISAQRQEVRPFTSKQIALLQDFAAQAVIAMENARLITETREALEQQTATAEVLQVINSSPGDLAPVFEAMVEKAKRLCDAAHGALRIYDGEAFHIAAADGDPHEVERLRRLGAIRHGFFESMTKGESVVHITDVRDTDDYRNNPTGRERMGGTRTWLGVALRKEGALLGAIIVIRAEVRPFSEKQIALLQNFAAQAVIAMENARLITETREALEQQTATAEVLGVI